MRATWATTCVTFTCIAAACGGPSAQGAERGGHRSTGAVHDADGELRASGGEVESGPCDVGPVYFAYDSSELDDRARNALTSNARCLEERDRGARIVGMTDPRGTEEYNLALGDRRAQTVTRYMANLGVEADSLSTHSLGEETARGEDESGWAQDRRADVQMQ